VARELIELFDELLKGNRQELEALYNRPRDGSKGTVSAGEGDSDTLSQEHRNIKQFDKGELTEMSAADWLDRHYPGEWRYDVRDRRREGNELVVLCRFELPGYGVRRTQFGMAEIERADNTEREAEETAYRQAIEDALQGCIRML
jgi:hypothetical protein